MKKKTVWISCITAVSLGSFLGTGLLFFEKAVVRHKKQDVPGKKKFELMPVKINHPRYQYGKEYEDGKEWCRMQNMQDCYIKSADGLRLHALFLPAENAKRIVLLSHGYRGSSFGNFARTSQFLHENQCSLLFIDQRCCGESEGRYITFGAKEQYDVQAWAYYLAARNKEKLPVYLFGKSMGATAVLMASGHKLPQEVKGLIADCGFRSMKGQIREMADSWFHFRWMGLLLFRLDVFCRVFADFCMKEADTAAAMRVNTKPVLFFHGSLDTYVSPENSWENYKLCQAPKELVEIPEARHLGCAYANPGLYRKKLMEFFDKYDQAE